MSAETILDVLALFSIASQLQECYRTSRFWIYSTSIPKGAQTDKRATPIESVFFFFFSSREQNFSEASIYPPELPYITLVRTGSHDAPENCCGVRERGRAMALLWLIQRVYDSLFRTGPGNSFPSRTILGMVAEYSVSREEEEGRCKCVGNGWFLS